MESRSLGKSILNNKDKEISKKETEQIRSQVKIDCFIVGMAEPPRPIRLSFASFLRREIVREEIDVIMLMAKVISRPWTKSRSKDSKFIEPKFLRTKQFSTNKYSR